MTSSQIMDHDTESASPRLCSASASGQSAERPAFLKWLAIWIALTVGLEGLVWRSGVKGIALSDAVEQGAAQIEKRSFGEVTENQVRKAIGAQHATLRFWTTVSLLGDFLIEPMSLIVRPLAVVTLLTTVAALTGRRAQFHATLGACARIQGFWVVGLATRVVLLLGLRLDVPETSLALALPLGTRSALSLLAARQADAFALCGWAALARAGWRLGQANLVVSCLVCALLALAEAAVCIGVALIVGAGMRRVLLPGI